MRVQLSIIHLSNLLLSTFLVEQARNEPGIENNFKTFMKSYLPGGISASLETKKYDIFKLDTSLGAPGYSFTGCYAVPSATLHQLQNPKWLPGGPKVTDWV